MLLPLISLTLLLELLIHPNAAIHDKITPLPQVPLIYAYSGPRAKGMALSLENLPSFMKTPNVVDIGPSPLSHPGGSYPDPKLVRHWKDQGIVVLRRVHTQEVRLDETIQRYLDVDEMIYRWSDAMKEPLVDGIVIDEFDTGRDEQTKIWITALKKIRSLYPDKYIFCWVLHQLRSPALLTALRDNSNFIIPEIFYKESKTTDFKKNGFPLYRNTVEMMDKIAPGIAGKILLGIGMFESLDDDVHIDFKEFVAYQIMDIAQNGMLKTTAGIALMAPCHASKDEIMYWDNTIDRYIMQK